MDKQQAQKIIKDTFERSFDMDRFTVFIKNLLNRIDESKAFHAHGYVKEGFRGIIKTYERVGTYNAPDDKKVDIIVVYLQKGSSLDHARVTQRNFAGRYLDDRGEKDAGLFAFVSPNEADWRFSLVKMDYKFDKNGKVKEEFTPARRWSFLVGANEKSHTAQSRLVKILVDDEHDPTLEEIENAFDIEIVTKEFFLKYRDLFLRTKEQLDRVVKEDPKIKADFKAKGVDSVNFAKKLLGQIIFLYFLQKKGWFGVGRDDDWGTGSKHFLRELFNKKHGTYKNFFNDILEPLFYEALATERESDYYARFNCKIPFLNGGLFDPIGSYDWVHTDILLPDELFSNTNKSKQGDVGDGILDVFDRYNFTVKEDEPLEKEVAIDPELLGKSYEKFNAIRPDNYAEFKNALKSGRKGEENKFNKKFGVYYTPREIVHYMCQQSLINYLATELDGKVSKEDIETLIHIGEQVSENEARVISEGRETKTYSHKLPESIRKNAALIDQKLVDITVCDPAVGSGAFPVGMMSEIVKTRNVLSTFVDDSERTPYIFKRQCIEHSLYGVDIDPGAIEIAKLRLWLSLVVDEDDYQNIKPLPNLDYKIMQGDSLVEDFHGVSLNLEKNDELLFSKNEELDILIEDLHRKQSEFFNAIHHSDKNRLKKEVEDAIIKVFHYELKRRQEQYFKALDRVDKMANGFPKEEDRKKCYDAEKTKLDKRYKFDFETVENELREMTHGNKIRNFFPWKLYFADLFRKNNGFDVVIANPPYVRADSPNSGHADFRKKLEESNEYKTLYEKWDLFIPFIERGLKVLSKKGNLRFITSNALCTSKYAHKLLNLIQKEYAMNSLDYFENMEVFEGVGVIPVVIGISKDKSSIKNVSKIIRQEAFENIRQEKRIPLNEFNKLGRDAFRKDYQEVSLDVETEKLGDICYISYGLRPNSDERYWKGEFTKNDLIRDTRDDIYCRRYIEGKNIDRYAVKKIQFLEWNTDRVPHKLVRKTFPELYDRPKILRGRVTGAIYDDSNLVCNDSIMAFVRFIDLAGVSNKSIKNSITKFNSLSRRELEEKSKGYDLKYLLAIMNSRFAYHYLNNRRRHRLENYFYPDDLRKLPIPQIALDGQQPFITLVDQILSLKESDPQADTSALEDEIDRMVYELYGLTEEEIQIMEGDK